MPSPYDKILTTAGLLENGALSKRARDRFVLEVLGLLATGNENGRGGTPSTKIFSSLVPLPPVPGPDIINLVTQEKESLFWFKPDPYALLTAPLLLNREKSPIWHAIFVDILFEKTAIVLDAAGSTPLFPVFDVSAPFGIDLPIPFTLPDLASNLKLTPPELIAKLAQAGIKLQLPSIPIPPLPPKFPDFSIPSLPGVPSVSPPSLVMPDLLIGLIKLPFDLIGKLLLPPDISLVINLPELPKKILSLALDIVIELLTNLGLLVVMPKLLSATILIYIKNIVAIIATDIVGMLVGAGNISKSIATLTGLV